MQKIQYFLSELFPAFTCANNLGNLVNSLFGVKNFNSFPSFTSSSLPSSAGIGGKSSNSLWHLL